MDVQIKFAQTWEFEHHNKLVQETAKRKEKSSLQWKQQNFFAKSIRGRYLLLFVDFKQPAHTYAKNWLQGSPVPNNQQKK